MSATSAGLTKNLVQPGTRSKFLFVQALTLARIPLIMVVLAVSLAFDPPIPNVWFALAFGAILLSALTDLLDGYFARELKVTSSLGSYADPLMDKVFYLTSFPLLIYLAASLGQPAHARLLVLLAVVFLLRDQWVSFLRSLGAIHGLSAKANWSGKARTAIAFPTICLVYYYLAAPSSWPLHPHQYLVIALELVSVVINFISIVVYTTFFWPALRKEINHGG